MNIQWVLDSAVQAHLADPMATVQGIIKNVNQIFAYQCSPVRLEARSMPSIKTMNRTLIAGSGNLNVFGDYVAKHNGWNNGAHVYILLSFQNHRLEGFVGFAKVGGICDKPLRRKTGMVEYTKNVDVTAEVSIFGL